MHRKHKNEEDKHVGEVYSHHHRPDTLITVQDISSENGKCQRFYLKDSLCSDYRRDMEVFYYDKARMIKNKFDLVAISRTVEFAVRSGNQFGEWAKAYLTLAWMNGDCGDTKSLDKISDLLTVSSKNIRKCLLQDMMPFACAQIYPQCNKGKFTIYAEPLQCRDVHSLIPLTSLPHLPHSLIHLTHLTHLIHLTHLTHLTPPH